MFVGGCATELLITDNAAAEVRPTLDVDAIVEITSYAGYETFSERLRKLGFQEDASENAPRWRQNDDFTPTCKAVYNLSFPSATKSPLGLRYLLQSANGPQRGLIEY